MSAKGSTFRKNHRLSQITPVIFSRKKEKHSAFSNESSSLSNDTAFYAISRKSSSKRLNLLIKESKKTRESLQKSEEEIRLFNYQLSCINQSTCSVIGNEYFENLVQSLASIFRMRYAFIGKIEEGSPKTLRTVALWDRDKIAENLTFFLKDTPCEKVIAREIGFYPQEAQKYFPNDQYLVDWDIHSYLGVPLLNSEKQPFGVLSVMDEKPIEDYDHYHSILSIFASRCASEMERMDAEARLELKALELKKNNQVLKDFISIASHDLQSPLGKTIQLGSQLAEKADNLKPESKEYLARMQKTACRMQNLVDDLLLFSQSSIQAEPFRKISLSMILREVIEDLDVMLHKNDGEIIVSPLPTIEGNPIQLEQLFKNLLSNALKFYDEGKPPKIEVYSQPCKSGGWEISTKDQGIGFDEKYMDRIFHPFERLHGINEYEGTGMGLAICQKIVENHGGTIQVQSQPGMGSCFTVVLPARHRKSYY